jgi:hypothetical protein
MEGGLTTAELHHLRVPFGWDESFEHGVDLFQTQVVPRSGVGKASGTRQVAAGIDLDEGQAGVLLVLRAQSTIFGAPLLYLGGELQGNGPWLVVLQGVDLPLGISRDHGLEPAVIGTSLPHEDPVFLQMNLGIDDLLALGTETPGQFIEH